MEWAKNRSVLKIDLIIFGLVLVAIISCHHYALMALYANSQSPKFTCLFRYLGVTLLKSWVVCCLGVLVADHVLFIICLYLRP